MPGRECGAADEPRAACRTQPAQQPARSPVGCGISATIGAKSLLLLLLDTACTTRLARLTMIRLSAKPKPMNGIAFTSQSLKYCREVGRGTMASSACFRSLSSRSEATEAGTVRQGWRSEVAAVGWWWWWWWWWLWWWLQSEGARPVTLAAWCGCHGVRHATEKQALHQVMSCHERIRTLVDDRRKAPPLEGVEARAARSRVGVRAYHHGPRPGQRVPECTEGRLQVTGGAEPPKRTNTWWRWQG